MKQQRHAVIRELVGLAPIASQDALRRKLAERGFHVTQATLSRDIHAMQLVKGPLGYAGVAAETDEESGPGMRELLRSFGLEARCAMNQVVIVTTTGGAQPIAAGLDYEDWPEVVGTIAGDDTVLVICPDARQAAVVRTRVEEYIG